MASKGFQGDILKDSKRSSAEIRKTLKDIEGPLMAPKGFQRRLRWDFKGSSKGFQ